MRSKRILVVDDSEIICHLIEYSIRKLGVDYQIVSTPDGITALAELYKHSFDLMITDYSMPDMTGMELAQKVRQILPEMRIVLMTAQDIIEKQAEARQRHLNLDGYLQKPFSLPQVRKIVKNHLAS